MGVIKHFSSDSRDFNYNPTPNPDPNKFKLVWHENINGYPVLLVNYPDCTNYEGDKILVYDRDFDINILLCTHRIDPHFYSAKDSPIARFEPTQRGWKMACSFALNYKEE